MLPGWTERLLCARASSPGQPAPLLTPAVKCLANRFYVPTVPRQMKERTELGRKHEKEQKKSRRKPPTHTTHWLIHICNFSHLATPTNQRPGANARKRRATTFPGTHNFQHPGSGEPFFASYFHSLIGKTPPPPAETESSANGLAETGQNEPVRAKARCANGKIK